MKEQKESYVLNNRRLRMKREMRERSGETENRNRFLEVYIQLFCVTQLVVYIEKGRRKVEEDRWKIKRKSCVTVGYRSLIGPRQCALAVVTRVSRVT